MACTTKPRARVVDPWPLGWRGLLAHVVAPFEPAEEDLCQDVEDVELAASLLVEWIGRHTAATKGAHRVSEGKARRIGEYCGCRRTAGGWARIGWRQLKKCPDSILFSTLDGKRVGANILVPLTKRGGRGSGPENLGLRPEDGGDRVPLEVPSCSWPSQRCSPKQFRSAARASWARLCEALLASRIALRRTWPGTRDGHPVLVAHRQGPRRASEVEGLGFT